MTREQFVARTGSIGVRVEEIGKVEDRIERMEGCGSQEGGGCAGRDRSSSGV